VAPYSGRAAAIALRLVGGLAGEPRRAELARICHWRAGLRWESLELPRIRDRPYEPGDGEGAIVQLAGSALSIRFRTRRTPTRAPVERFTAADAPWSRRRGGNGH
jgi:hypothetical protein